ncbi:MAG: archaellin/type IV pilin N-terminal domain-containing protein [Desulfurococcales archaeon]|jgi:flagellin FlaB
MVKTRISRKLKAIVGIESAIVLIAFVVVAAALAFVVLNMGFFTTQRSKETIGSGLAQASNALEIDGTVLTKINTTGKNLECMIIPLRLSAGQKPVDLTPNKTSITVWVLGKFAEQNLYTRQSQAITDLSDFTIDNLCANATQGGSNANVAMIWQTGNNGDNVLDPGEKALLVVKFTSQPPEAYDVIKVEVRVTVGAALTVERTVPPSLTQQVVDLG